MAKLTSLTPPPIAPTEPRTTPVTGAMSTPPPTPVKAIIAKPEQLKFVGPQFILDKDKVFQGIRVAGFKGYVPYSTVPAGKATMEWEGGKICSALWHQICAFFEWTQEEFKSEGQVRLFYNRDNRKWAAWAFPQECNGMTTKELPDDTRWAAQRAQFPPPWDLMGTVHHHCTSSAFQSGVDLSNESTQEGVHVTVGGVSTTEYSLHGRVIVRSTQYDIHWPDWFGLPAVLQAALPFIPATMHNELVTSNIKLPPGKDCAFPEAWKTNCSKPTYKATHYSGGGGSHRGGAASETTGKTTFLISPDLRSQFTEGEIDFMKEAELSYTQRKLTHTEADTLFAESADKLSEEDWKWVKGLLEMAKKFNVSDDRADELFDKWDFPTVLDELKITRV